MGIFLFGLLMLHNPQACFNDVCVHVEVVKNKQDMVRGLSGRENLGEDQGMLFVFDAQDRYPFWMKDMKFGLDIIWLDDKGNIVDIAANLAPCAKDDCPKVIPSEKARYVLEVNPGFAKSHKIGIGSTSYFLGL